MGERADLGGVIQRGEVRLYRFARPDRIRPVVVLTRQSSIPHLSSITVAPITSSVRDIASQVKLNESDGMKGPCAVDLHHVLSVPKSQAGRRVASLSPERLQQIGEALDFALGCGG